MRLPALGLTRRVAVPTAGLPVAGRLALTVRPEDIVLGGDGQPGALQGVISGQAYLGAAMRYLIAVGELTMIASLPCRVGQPAALRAGRQGLAGLARHPGR